MLQAKHDGFGLLELLIAMTLGLLLSAAVMQVTLASQRSHHLLDAAARLQENGRFALSYLSKDIRTAGYMGCPNVQRIPVNVIAKTPATDLNFTAAAVLVGTDNAAAGNAYDAVAGTDFVVLQRALALPARLTGNLDPHNANVQIDSNPAGIGRGDFVFITDCVNADLFEATTVSSNRSNDRITITHANNKNDNNRLSKIYGRDAEILGFQSLAYFIRDTGRTTEGSAPIRSLYVKARNLGGGAPPVAIELVEGVEDMQLSYGVDSDADNNVDAYKTASDISDWTTVLSVRIELLLHSLEDNIVGTAGAFAQSNLTFNGDTVASDGRLRQVYTSVVAIRNRLP